MGRLPLVDRGDVGTSSLAVPALLPNVPEA